MKTLTIASIMVCLLSLVGGTAQEIKVGLARGMSNATPDQSLTNNRYRNPRPWFADREADHDGRSRARPLSLSKRTTTMFDMPLTLDQITEEAIKLPPASRAPLADKLVQSLELEDLDEIQRLWSAEAIRRRDEIRSGQVQPISGEQVIEEVRRLVGR